jgi:hypothetical protein
LLNGNSKQQEFDKYLEALRVLATWDEIPFKARLLALNKLRVNSKHYGLLPAREELLDLMPVVREFFAEIAQRLIGANFFTLTLVDLLPDGEIKTLLGKAHDDFANGDFQSCLIECRKAIYIAIESDYDVGKFKDGKPLGLLGGFTKAPYFARNPEYISTTVREPTDYIVLDYHAIEMELLAAGADTTAFWNVLRLTPAAYRQSSTSGWIVKNDLALLDDEGVEGRAEYILSESTAILIALAFKKEKAKYPESSRYFVPIGHPVQLFRKASKNSELIGCTPPGLTKLNCDYSIDGLDGDGVYWHITHYADGLSLHGFIHNQDVATE